MQPLEEFLETSVGQDCFHGIERVPKLVMTPGLVDEILAGMTRRHDFGSAFAARHHVMSTRRDLPFTERARIGHRIFIGSIVNHRNIENGGRSGNRTHDRSNLQPLSRRCPRLCRTSSSLACESRTHLRGFADHCLGCSANGTKTPRKRCFLFDPKFHMICDT